MSRTWHSEAGDLPMPRPGPAGYALALLRFLALALALLVGLLLYGLVRLLERPLRGQGRPVSAWIAQGFCRAGVHILGLRYRIEGAPMRHPGAVVANHCSWLDIFALYGAQRVYFISKAEVRGWPLIGPLAALVGTIFIRRERREALAQTKAIRARFGLGHKLLFFPEGTSTDGRHLLPFKATLFASFLGEQMGGAWLQPVSLIYEAPPGADPRFYGWFGTMELGAHFLTVASRWRQGGVVVQFHPPLRAADYPDRRALAAACEAPVREGLAARNVLEGAARLSPTATSQ